MQVLVEREGELETFRRGLQAVLHGTGGVLTVAGAAGIGKSSLLEEVARRAAAAGIRVLSAQAGELERDLPYGIARRVFAPVIDATSTDTRGIPDTDARRVVAPLLLGVAPGEADEPALRLGLHDFCVEVATRAPLLVVVDDLQWVDDPSARWLAYTARRARQVPVLLVAGIRASPDSPVTGIPAAISDCGPILVPRPLSAAAATRLAPELGVKGATQPFIDELLTLTGGNPFYLRELLGAAGVAQLAGGAQDVPALRRIRAEGIVRSVNRRVRSLGPDAVALSRAVFVLGTTVAVARAAAVAQLDPAGAGRVADVLADAEVLVPGRPLRFAHPVVRAAIGTAIRPAELAESHARAADVLAREGASPVEVGLHLQRCEPCGNAGVVEGLLDAANATVIPEARVQLLRRALAEPPPAALRGRVLRDLAQAELASLDDAAVAHFEQAMALADSTSDRAELAAGLVGALFLCDRREEAKEVGEAALQLLEAALDAPAGDPDREAHLWLEAHLLTLEGVGTPTREWAHRRAAEAAAAGSVGEQALLAPLAAWGSALGFTAPEVTDMARSALKGQRLLDEGAAVLHYFAIWALEFADQLDAAREQVALLQAGAHGRSPSGRAFITGYSAVLAMRRGDVLAALESGQQALDLARDVELAWVVSLAGPAVLDALLERKRHADAHRLLEHVELDGGLRDDAEARTRPQPSTRAYHLFVRARLHVATGRADLAERDLRACGALLQDIAFDSPAYYGWRSELSAVLAVTGRLPQALQLVAEELELATEFGAARPVGRALRAAGLLHPGARGIELLREAVSVLEESPAALERARAAASLGAALRRDGKRDEARAVLLQALDLAGRCASLACESDARRDLDALGLKPRRTAASGAGALTAREAQVAALLADGATNGEVAAALFVSIKTVERHVSSVLGKLGITSRRQVAGALQS